MFQKYYIFCVKMNKCIIILMFKTIFQFIPISLEINSAVDYDTLLLSNR